MAVIRNLILDWSGTLVNDFPPVLVATNEIFKQYGRSPMTEVEFRERFFLPFPEFYKIHLPEATLEDLDRDYHRAFQLLQEEIPLLPHALEFLEYCKEAGMPLFLLSSIHQNHWKAQSERIGIASYFQKAYVQVHDKRKTILHLLAEQNLDPHETMFIGDMLHDVESARHGGVVSCAVLTGYDSLAKLRSSNPDLLFRNLHHVRHYLERHREEPKLPPIGTVGALIFNRRNEVLMLRTYKWSNRWGIPGGKIKGEEASEAALHREVLEETGLTLQKVQFAIVQDCIRSEEFYKQAHFLLLNYVAWTDGEAVVLNDEAEEFRWVSLDVALTMDLNRPTRTLIDYVRLHHLA